MITNLNNLNLGLTPPTIDIKLLLRYVEELKVNFASLNLLKNREVDGEINVEYLVELGKFLGLLDAAKSEITLLIGDVKKVQNFASSPISPETKRSMEELQAVLKGTAVQDDFGALGDLVPFPSRKPRGSSGDN